VYERHRFILKTVAPFNDHVYHIVKQALKMLWFIRYITCYSFTVDSPIIVRCATAQSKFQFSFTQTHLLHYADSNVSYHKL